MEKNSDGEKLRRSLTLVAEQASPAERAAAAAQPPLEPAGAKAAAERAALTAGAGLEPRPPHSARPSPLEPAGAR